MPRLRHFIVAALVAVFPSFPASAEKHWLEVFLDAKRGCANAHVWFLPGSVPLNNRRIEVDRGRIDVELYGKPLLKWSDDDIATVGRIYRDCLVKLKVPPNSWGALQARFIEPTIDNIITKARDIDNQRKAKETARIELQKAQAQMERERAEEEAQRQQQQLREQTQRNKEAAEEARRRAEIEEPKIAEATKEAEEARRAREEAERRLADIRSRIDAQVEARKRALQQAQSAEAEIQRQAEADATRPLPPITETITIAERDMGCLDKAITQAAIQKPLRWVPKPSGQKGFYLPFADAFISMGGCIYWSVDNKARVQRRDGELACLERIDAPRTGECYWTATERPPSKRAGPMPSEDSKPPYDKSLWEAAQNEIKDALEAMPGYEQLPPDQERKIRTQLLRQQGAQYAHESDRYMSGRCAPTSKGDDAETTCEFTTAEFQRNYGLALRGDYQAQQDVAFCLGSSKLCDEVVTAIFVRCYDRVCIARGLVDFRAVDAVAKILSEGVASFEYQLILAGTTMKISLETGEVKSRTRTPLTGVNASQPYSSDVSASQLYSGASAVQQSKGGTPWQTGQ